MNSSYPNSLRRSVRGFTLLEVLIAMAILAFISLAIFQATTGSFRLREELNAEAEFFTGIRLAMGIMNRDVSLAYSPIVLAPPTKKDAASTQSGSPSTPPQGRNGSNIDETGISANTAAELAQSFTFWSAATDKSGLRPSRFIGDDKKMSFISSSHYRIYKDSPESIFAKVTYELKRDDDPPVNGFKADGSSVLVKSASANAFDPDDLRDRSYTHTYPLLRGVVQGSFVYYKWEENSFKRFTSWDSDKEDFKHRLPDIVEVTLNVQGPTRLSFEGTYRFKPEIPLRGINPSH